VEETIGDRSLHLTGSSRATVFYRNGYEVVDAGPLKGKKPKRTAASLIIKGTFGPILRTAMLDAAYSGLTWSHWEEGPTGLQAVFRYEIPEARSHVEVGYCCFPDGDGKGAFQQLTGYHGEIAIDPPSGAILRLILETDLESDH
jgi:hypothetical protein